MTEFELDFYTRAFFQSNEIRTARISNIDQQVNTIRTIFVSLLFGFITLVFGNRQHSMLLLSMIMTVLFWCIETRCKQNQRGYIYVSNNQEKELINIRPGEEAIVQIIQKYAFDLNGFVTNKKNLEYCTACSFRHTMWMKNVRSFYLWLLLLQIILLVVVERKSILLLLCKTINS